ncbi:MAG: ATP-binding protein [Candidatus Gracilibacteria bacterium]|nr:ATP-binding protein [Candidatus Gracilibacteria bacterium]MDD2908128.1 ATP-binding protein [Candidatus Gracilibacteria bacterium]
MSKFKQIILDNQNLIKNIDTIKRDYTFYIDLLKLNKIVSFVGPRRVGKTFLMIDFVKELIRTNIIYLDQIVFIDFSLYTNEIVDSQEILLDFKEIYPNKEPFFIFDEVQDITNFKELVLSLYNQGYKIFLSGSNSKLLSSELSTHFGGRVFEYKILPLTYKEVLRFKKIEYKKDYSTIELASINNIISEMLEFGTFPEILLSTNNLFKIDNLKTYLDILVYKDLIERYKIENEVSLKYILKSITSSFTKNVNINKIYNELKSLNIKIGKTTLYEYYEYIKNVFYTYELENYYNQKSFKKAFLYNIGFNKILGNKQNLGQSFENIIFIELLKKYNKVYFKKNGTEIDFYIPEINTNIQVCYELNIENYKREISAFGNNNEKNILVYFLKDMKIDKNDNFELMNFSEFISFIDIFI